MLPPSALAAARSASAWSIQDLTCLGVAIREPSCERADLLAESHSMEDDSLRNSVREIMVGPNRRFDARAVAGKQVQRMTERAARVERDGTLGMVVLGERGDDFDQ